MGGQLPRIELPGSAKVMSGPGSATESELPSSPGTTKSWALFATRMRHDESALVSTARARTIEKAVTHLCPGPQCAAGTGRRNGTLLDVRRGMAGRAVRQVKARERPTATP